MSDARLSVEIITLFPELFDSFLTTSLLGKAIGQGLIAVHRTNPRAFGLGRHHSVDDTPYGGGPGMVLRPEPMVEAVERVLAARGPAHRVLLSPQGRLFDQAKAAELVGRRRVLFICGRYEGFDERIAAAASDEVLSLGDYVLAGGELAAAVMLEAMSRLVPGVLGCEASVDDESHAVGHVGRLEYPHYTRPPVFRGLPVPDVLLSGDHARIARWRLLEALRRTQERRPDLVRDHPVTDQEKKALAEGGKAEGKAPRPERKPPGA
jgi:tRNA (guanine37-N1)-methyltransferase